MKSFALHLVVVFIVVLCSYISTTTGLSTISSSPLLSSSSSSSSSSASTGKSTTTTRLPSLAAPLSLVTTSTMTTLALVAPTIPIHTETRNRTGRSSFTGNTSGDNPNSSFGQRMRLHRSRPSFYDYHEQQQTLTKQNETTKTPRMIQRLVAGHLQHVTTERQPQELSTTTSTTTLRTVYKRKPYQLSSTYRLASKKNISESRTTTVTPIKSLNDEDDDIDNRDNDEAFLEDPRESDNWDNGILRLSAGAGKELQGKSKKKDDTKKTLSDQVKDGKYGLIEHELFSNSPKRPGIISYLSNKEVPADTAKNLGGLDEEDIWLAEDHLLVIKGGGFNEKDNSELWPPIDNYEAPNRQIKIPTNPKVPPPFPVQFEDNGPIQFIGENKFSFFYPHTNETIPVYSTSNADYKTSETVDSDSKNLLTRTGSSKDIADGKNKAGGYLYPAPYPTWLLNNETYANTILANRDTPLPAIGPFSFAFNGSLDNLNTTDYFDEDDQSIYYPPPYSFVYKSNYTNPVAPGPLVPGIVLPPPPNAFARLQEQRTRVTTTPIPFRQILTKISEYTPKTIIVTPINAGVSSPLPTSRPSSTTTTFAPHTVQIQKEIIYAVTEAPTKPPQTTPKVKVYTTQKQEIVSFVPTIPPTDTFSKSNPIYYEYYDARQDQPTTQKIYDFVPTTPQPVSAKTTTKKFSNKVKIVTLQPTSKNRIKSNYVQQQPPQHQPQRQQHQFLYDDFVYITPKPEIRPNGISKNFLPFVLKPSFKNKPAQNFEDEVDAIRQTLQFYKNQQLRENNIPRTPKSKPVYEYSFEATKTTKQNFDPHPKFDTEPFQPMVTYSPSVDDPNSFKAIAYSKVDQVPNNFYTTTELPQTVQVQQPRQKKIRVGAKYLQPLVYDPQSTIRPPSSPRTVLTTEQPWISIEKQQLQEVGAKSNQNSRAPVGNQRGYETPNNQHSGYYYNQPSRQNTRYYEEPFMKQLNPIKSIINQYKPYQRQQHSQQLQQLQQQPQQQQPQQQQQQQQQWSLENDTYVNYAPNRPPLNPDAEFINPYQHQNRYTPSYSQHQQRLPSQQPQQFYNPIINRNPQGPPYFHHPPQPQQQQQQQPIPLHRDTLVNYRQPLPPLNPDSEFISHPQVSNNPRRNSQLPPSYRPINYRVPIVDQVGTYYNGPKFRRNN